MKISTEVGMALVVTVVMGWQLAAIIFRCLADRREETRDGMSGYVSTISHLSSVMGTIQGLLASFKELVPSVESKLIAKARLERQINLIGERFVSEFHSQADSEDGARCRKKGIEIGWRILSDQDLDRARLNEVLRKLFPILDRLSSAIRRAGYAPEALRARFKKSVLDEFRSYVERFVAVTEVPASSLGGTLEQNAVTAVDHLLATINDVVARLNALSGEPANISIADVDFSVDPAPETQTPDAAALFDGLVRDIELSKQATPDRSVN